MNDHPDLEKLDPSAREIVREVFRDPANGTPDDISKAGCWALAAHSFEVWNAWREIFPVKLYFGAAFAGSVKNAAQFELAQTSDLASHPNEYLSFNCFTFGRHAKFTGDKQHLLNSSFENASFGEGSTFLNVCFAPWASFACTQFEGDASFRNCVFTQFADFSGCQTIRSLVFTNVTFYEGSRFWGIQVGRTLRFDTVTFSGAVSFKSQSWEQISNYCDNLGALKKWGEKYGLAPNVFYDLAFSGCTFTGDVDFSGRTFLDRLIFDKNTEGELNTFKFSPPLFFQSQIHQNTSFSNVAFPKPYGSEKASKAYGALKLAFSKQLASREEQRFFRLEMAEEAAMATGFQRFLYRAYSLTSDYGFSLSRPSIMLGVTLLVATVIYGVLSWQANCTPAHCVLSTAWLEFSLLQALPLPGLDKLNESLRVRLFAESGWISVLVTLTVIMHKATSLLALFLIGLGLRNLFKLK